MGTTDTGSHVHEEGCGHLRVKHGDHFDFLDEGHLIDTRAGKTTEHRLDVSTTNPNSCQSGIQLTCFRKHSGTDPQVPHGDHVDFICHGRLHHVHGDHCDDHGPVETQ